MTVEYPTPKEALMEWKQVEAGLRSAVSQAPETGGPDRHTCWLTTIDPDGKPHVTPVGALWVDGAFWFQTGERTRKAKNIANDPRCSLAVATHDFDLVVEGVAERVSDRASIAMMAEAWAAQGWPAEIDGTGTGITAPFNAPGTGEPPWFVYRITAKTAKLVGTTESTDGAARFDF
jgi:hypothetical protein